MHFYKLSGLIISMAVFILSCQKDEYPTEPLFNVEIKVNTTLNPLPDKIRVVLCVGRGVYEFERSQNPLGNPDKAIRSSLTSAFWQITDAAGQANFSDLAIARGETGGKRKRDTRFLCDTIFIRVEARQIIGTDTIYKTNDADPVFFPFHDPLEGNITINLKKEITL